MAQGTLIRVADDALELFEKCPERNNARVPTPGIYFASCYLPGYTGSEFLTLPDLQITDKRPLLNAVGAAAVIVFETLIDSVDGHMGNIFFVPLDDENGGIKGVEVYLIDLGHVFGGPGWPSLNAPDVVMVRPQRSAYFGVGSQQILTDMPPVQKLASSLTVPQIHDIYNLIPSEWGMSVTDRDQISHFLTARIQPVCDAVNAHLTAQGGGTP